MLRSMQRGELYILSAPSGSGKTTLIDALFHGGLERCGGGTGDIAFSISHTTRAPRAGEREGVDYHFVDRPTFGGWSRADGFSNGRRCTATSTAPSRTRCCPDLERGVDVVLDIDVQGAEIVMSHHPEAHGIFILPPSYEALERPADGEGAGRRADDRPPAGRISQRNRALRAL